MVGAPLSTTYKGVRIARGMAYYPRPAPFRYYLVVFYHRGIYFRLSMRIPGESSVPRQPDYYFSREDYDAKGEELAKWVIEYFDRNL